VTESWDRLDARLRAAIGAAAGELADSGAAHWQGRELGAYRIESRISAGGMGVVYRACRSDEQFERLVAIKVMHGPLASDEARRRFFAERQILADLNHPNVAQLLDGGTTSEGVPYLVMEYIDGKPIDEYCRDGSLSLAQKLRLFIDVCSAVQYAHQHLIVHRDIKASNILVTTDGVPKLLDFGIAKLLDGGDKQRVAADLTLADARLLTPRNASPEQVRGAAITTASDIYSLGVLLYELLASRPPYTIQGTTSLELERAICETEPAPPSRHDPQLAGDLDTIILMALRKDPARRYSTARQLAEDIERHLAHRPVTARPESWSYRAGKFLRRNAWATAATALVLVTVASLVTFYTLQLKREREQLARERATAEEVSAFLVGLFEEANPAHSRPDVSARQVLEDGVVRIDELQSRQPLVAAPTRDSVCTIARGSWTSRRCRSGVSSCPPEIRASPRRCITSAWCRPNCGIMTLRWRHCRKRFCFAKRRSGPMQPPWAKPCTASACCSTDAVTTSPWAGRWNAPSSSMKSRTAQTHLHSSRY